eukprot:Sspe_Gene.98104::Locus_71556_Transcript_1_1_Confidence_1.000_Length_689::g.98104::m.98104
MDKMNHPATCVVVSCIVSSVVAAVWQRTAQSILFPRIAALQREIEELEAEADTLNTPSNFAKCAQLQRKAQAKREELDKMHSEVSSWKKSIPSLVYFLLKFSFIAVAIAVLGSTTLVEVKQNPWGLLIPVLFVTPRIEIGVVGLAVATLITCRAFQLAVTHTTYPALLKPKKY